MIDAKTLDILQAVFIRLFRSYGQFLLHEAWPVFDVAEEPIRQVALEQREEATRLGELIVRETGTINTGQYPSRFGDLHYLNASRILLDWVPEQRALVAELEKDVSNFGSRDDVPARLVREILVREQEHLASLEQIVRQIPAHSY